MSKNRRGDFLTDTVYSHVHYANDGTRSSQLFDIHVSKFCLNSGLDLINAFLIN